MPEITQTAEQVASSGPWVTLSVSLVCATVAFIFIGLKHYMNKKENGSHTSMGIMNKRIDRLHEKVDALTKEVSDIKANLSFLCGKMNQQRM